MKIQSPHRNTAFSQFNFFSQKITKKWNKIKKEKRLNVGMQNSLQLFYWPFCMQKKSYQGQKSRLPGNWIKLTCFETVWPSMAFSENPNWEFQISDKNW